MTTQTQHTPGPWINNRGSVLAKGGTVKICDMKTSIGEDAANARLIAAAPDLLDALESVLGLIPDNSASKAVCRAAIAKARGQS